MTELIDKTYPPTHTPTGSYWKHLKSGHTYVVTGECRLERENIPAVLYRRVRNLHEGAEGSDVVWAREKTEFLDGRFERLP